MQLPLAVLAAVSIASLTDALPAPVRHAPAPERVAINDNRTAAGTLRNGVLTIRLEAREGDWRPDGDNDPGLVVRVFAERGRRAVVPGPMIRVPEGTEIHAFVTNTLPVGTLVVRGLSTRGVADAAGDTVQIQPGATREVRFLAGAPGTYYYRGEVDSPRATGDRSTRDGELNGAFIVDARGVRRPPNERVLLISLWNKSPTPNGLINRSMLTRFTVNGKAWPHTERLSYATGDSVRFRVINASTGVHPMHLHGFYFNVDSRGDGMVDSVYRKGSSPKLVVTERTAPGRTFTMTWVPERAGNWLFHCHDNFHVLRNAPLDGSPMPAEHAIHPANHAMEMMGGLVMGIAVRGHDAVAARPPDPARRRLRLVARVDSGGTDAEPAFGYELLEGAMPARRAGPMLPGPLILLERGKPVGITVVNELHEATAVHWHGIELDSYFDGVAGFSGAGRRISPVIAPGDSFEARFTPPRSGTFMYHPHADEVRQQQAGLTGVLLVHDAPARFDPASDIVLLLTVPRREANGDRVLVNGSLAPSALELRVGQRYRLRIVDVHTYRPSMIARLLRDATPSRWRAVAKDGMDLPADQATERPSVQQMGNGETFDFEVTPTEAGDLTFTVSSAAGLLLASMPVRVR
jgi:FtsP/CotA-like multicopper oxidase with cupredoxin domain